MTEKIVSAYTKYMAIITILVGMITFLVGRETVAGQLMELKQTVAVDSIRISNLECMQKDVKEIKELLLRHIGEPGVGGGVGR